MKILRIASAGLAMKMAGAALAVGSTALLARILGPAELGKYSFVLALITILAIPAQVGLPKFVTRETAELKEKSDYFGILSVWRWAHSIVFLLATLISIIGIIYLTFSDAGFSDPKLYVWGFILLPLVTLGNVRGAALAGLGRVLVGQLPDTVLRPLFFILFLLAAHVLAQNELKASIAMATHVAGAFTAFLIGTAMLLRHKPAGQIDSRDRAGGKWRWIISATTLGMVGSLQVLSSNLDAVMLGLLSRSEEVGFYRVAGTLANLVTFGLISLSAVLMPRVAQLHSSGKFSSLIDVVRESTRLSFAWSLAVTGILAIGGEHLAAVMFGNEYRASYPPLVVLIGGHAVSGSFGLVGGILIMTRHENMALLAAGIACGLNITLNYTLIPYWGATGAATATAASLTVSNILMWLLLMRETGINTVSAAFGRSKNEI